MPQDKTYWRTRPADDPKKDWEGDGTWLDGYKESVKHPHRQWLLTLLQAYRPKQVFEVGCNAAPNLRMMLDAWPFLDAVAGIDPSPKALEAAQELVPEGKFMLGDATVIPRILADMVIADASLMYVPPEDITRAMNNIARVTRKNAVILDWYADSLDGVELDHHWARDYGALLKERGFTVTEFPVTHEVWPTEKWVTNGRLWIGTRYD